ncbi:MAG: DNA primase family protein, partial [Gammaproteobacteria bacterium]
MTTISFSRGADKFDAYPEPRSAGCFEDFAAAVLADRSPRKGRAYIAGPFRQNGDGRHHRCAMGVLPRAFIALDQDGAAMESFALLCLRLAAFEGVGWQTASSTRECPRFRAVLALSREVDRSEGIRLGAELTRRLSEGLGPVAWDESTHRGEQPCYLPLLGAESMRWDGEPVDVDALLAQAPPIDEKRGPMLGTDPILQALSARGLVKGEIHGKPGAWAILCPWRGAHTTGDDGAAFFEPHTNGFAGPGFKCQHAHCGDRTIRDLRKFLGLRNSTHEDPPVASYAEEARGEEVEGAATSELSRFNLTDLGNAHRFARDHGAEVRYCWPWAKWLVWNDRFWSRDDSGEIHRLGEATVRGMYEEAARSSPDRREALAKWAVKSESHERRSKMLASAQAIEGVPVLPKHLDQDPWALNVGNGTIDLRTGALRPHAREDFITRGIDVGYDPAAMCPTWDRFMREVFADDDETIAFVRRAVGYSLSGDTREHVFFILHGVGSNGKSTFLGAIHDLLGAYAGRVPAELLMVRRGEHHPTERATLFGKRLVSSSETGDGRRLAEDLVKSLTGGDPISCRRMKEDFWEFLPTHKLWLATNHRPQIKGTDHAIWRRIKLIQFGVTFHPPEAGKKPPQDPTLPDRLREEQSGILAWAVRGCLDWQRVGLKTPKAVRAATEEYRSDMDTLGGFLEECCVLDRRGEAGATDLYKAYCAWCERAGESVEAQRTFGGRLRERGLVQRKSHGRKVWKGIGLLTGDDGDHGDQVSGWSTRQNTQIVQSGNRSPSSPSSPATCPRCAGEGCDWCGGADT